MKRTPKYVGLDVHQATTVAAVREEAGQVIARTLVPTEQRALVEFFRGMRGAIHVAFEEGTQSQWLHDLLEKYNVATPADLPELPQLQAAQHAEQRAAQDADPPSRTTAPRSRAPAPRRPAARVDSGHREAGRLHVAAGDR